MGRVRLNQDRPPLPKYVIEYEVPKGSGKWFVYFRRRGQKDIRMRGTPGTPEWEALYRSLLAGEIPEEKQELVPPAENTFAWLCQQYLNSSEFAELDESTKRVRRQILEHCVHETIDGKKGTFGDVPLSRFTPKSVSLLRDKKNGFPEAANGRVKALRQVFKWASLPEVGLFQGVNPARDVQYRKGNPDGHHTWTIDEVEQYEARHPVGTKARLALALCLYTFQRRSDVHRIGRQHERNGSLIFTQFKGRNKSPTHMEIPILPELRAILDASPLGDTTYLVNEFGVPYTAGGFGNKMRDWCDAAGLPHCSAHGLRKAACVRMAENGATPHQIQAWSGHKTLKEVDRYTKEAARRKLAKTGAALAGRSV